MADEEGKEEPLSHQLDIKLRGTDGSRHNDFNCLPHRGEVGGWNLLRSSSVPPLPPHGQTHLQQALGHRCEGVHQRG